MNFKSFITEGYKEQVELILKDCQQFIKEVGTYGMYRGMKTSKMFAEVIPRTDRIPKDTPIDKHEEFNKEFNKLYKVKDIRSRAVFVIGSQSSAEDYGDVYHIFPVDGYTYWWSKTVEDLYKDLDDYDSYSFLRVHTYNNTHLKEALLRFSENEIMLLCSKYYAVHWTSPVLDNINIFR